MDRVARMRGLLRSTPVRLALGMVALFTAVSLTTLALAYLQIRTGIEAGLNANLDQQVAGFQVAASPEALAVMVNAEAAAADPEARVFVLIGPDGRSFGNAVADLRGDEVVLRQGPTGKPLDGAGYVSRVVPMVGGLLVVAESRKPLRDLQDTFWRLLLVSLVPTVLLSLGAAVGIALSSARRVRKIEATLGALAGGNLAARVNEPDRRDDLARIGQGLDRMAAAQQASTDALRQVSADIAHDLKTPVQRIAVLLADLRDRLPDTAPEAAIADRAADEAARAVAVFQSLLHIAQIEGGSPKGRFAPVDLADLVRVFAEIYGPSAEDSGHILALALPGGPVTVQGDKGLLGQVIANLIENALRHTPAGSRVEVGLADDTLTVADNGPGIPEGERGNVLRRLYRLDRSRTTPGNGLGLSLVAAIVDLHGATMDLSDNQPGLRVAIRFPGNKPAHRQP